MDVKGFEKTETPSLSGVSSITGLSSLSEQERNMSFKPKSGFALGTTAGVASMTVMDLIPVTVEGQCEPVGSVEERLQQITPTTKEQAVTLDDNKIPVVANVFPEKCVSSNSLNSTAYVTGSKENSSGLRTLGSSGTVASNVIMNLPHVALMVDHSNLTSYEIQSNQLSTDHPPRIGAAIDEGAQTLNAEDMTIEIQSNQLSTDYPNRIGAVIEHRAQKLHTNDKAIEDEDKHKDTERRGILATGVKLERDKRSRVKTGRWTRLSSRVGVDNLETSTFNKTGTKRNFSGTFEAMVVDTENEKKPKFQNGSDEHGVFLTSQLGSAEAVEQPRWDQ
nr:hypothetical protein CFP56_15070 [Quercus suber]